ncbi:MAG: cob(I)yrinic acid a,c-diamide adenosyltransferase [Candidatus Egerieousia sp.]
MKIYTKTGDDGTTSLIGGVRVPKNNPRVEAYGETDELLSYLGIIISRCEEPTIRPNAAKEIEGSLLRIQKALMLVAAHFATPENGTNKSFPSLDECEIAFLEDEIDRMTAEMPVQKAFIIPGAPVQAAQCQFARTICRRVERRSLELTANNEELQARICMGRKYLNRLSDYLFTLGRYFCAITNTPEEFWLP